MKLRNLFRRPKAATPVTTGAALTVLPAKRRGVSDDAAMMTHRRRNGVVPSLETFSLPRPAPGVVPEGGMAMDSMAQLGEGYNWAIQGMWREGLGFLGYPYLAELTQRPEYRRAVEIIAKEMTRRWIELTAVGDKEDKAEKIAKLEAAMERFNVQTLFRQAAEQDGFYGRSQLYIGMKNAPAGDKERAKPLILDPAKVEKDGLAYMRLVEPYWSYPGAFNADRPLELDFYQPQLWYVMGETIHVSRLVLFVGREMPDILKPAYQFGGLSLSQMGKPYVDNWLRTRQSVSDLIHSFSVMVLSTDLSQLLAGANDAASLMNRLAVFNNLRDNAGTFAIDKDSETFANVAAPIAGLHELQAQAQEHMASVWGIPLVVYTGITPSGLNASSEGELQTFYAWVKAQQEHLFRPNLKYVLDILQLNEFGEIDPDIGFQFVDLWQPSESEQAANRKTEAETDKTYVDAGILSPEEIRERLAEDADSPYHGLDLSAPPPEPPADPSLETDPALEEDVDAEETAQDAGFEESKHPRAKNGQFGSGGGGGGAAPKGGGEKLAGIMAEVRARKEKAKKIAAAGKPMVFEHTNGARTMIAPDLENPGTWRTTRVDAQGEPFGHVENVDPTDAVMEALNSGATLKPSIPFSPADLKGVPPSSQVRQPAKSWDEIQTAGVEARDAFAKGLGKVQKQMGLKVDVSEPEKLTEEQAASSDGYLFIAPNKSEARSREKVEKEYGGDWSQLKDYVRGTIAVRSPEDVSEAIDKVKALGWKLAAVPKDNMSKPTPAGYRDVNTLWEMPNGMLAELQFNTKSMLRAKGPGHGLYEEQQKLQRKNGSNTPNEKWSTRDRKKWEEALGAQQKIYSEAWTAAA